MLDACAPEPVPLPVPDKVLSSGQLPMNQFDPERLDVYQAAIEFVAIANDVVEGLPRGRAYLASQLQRASSSIALNIAEGAGEFSRQDKARFYRVARRSATESAAVLDVCHKLSMIDENGLFEARDVLLRIVAMLTKLIRGLEEGERE